MIEILCQVYHFSFLSSGDSFTGLKARFHTGKSTIHNVVVETCQAIWDVLKDEILPSTVAEVVDYVKDHTLLQLFSIYIVHVIMLEVLRDTF